MRNIYCPHWILSCISIGIGGEDGLPDNTVRCMWTWQTLVRVQLGCLVCVVRHLLITTRPLSHQQLQKWILSAASCCWYCHARYINCWRCPLKSQWYQPELTIVLHCTVPSDSVQWILYCTAVPSDSVQWILSWVTYHLSNYKTLSPNQINCEAPGVSDHTSIMTTTSNYHLKIH